MTSCFLDLGLTSFDHDPQLSAERALQIPFLRFIFSRHDERD